MQLLKYLGLGAAALVLAAAGLFAGLALPHAFPDYEPLRQVADLFEDVDHDGHDDHGHDDHAADDDHDHAHEEEEHGDHLELSATAIANLGLEVGPVELGTFVHHVQVPAVVIEKPDSSNRAVASTVHGVVQRVHAVPGQVIHPGDPLVDLRLTGEGLATAQSQLLRVTKQLDVNRRELERVTPLVAEGAVPERTKLELDYRRAEFEAEQQALRQELLVRGLSPDQVERIETSGQLLREFTIYAPHVRMTPSEDETPAAPSESVPPFFTMETLHVFPGKQVAQGEKLFDLADHAVLYIEGHAFESDLPLLDTIARRDDEITATFGHAGMLGERRDLRLLYVDNHVHEEQQTFPFYLPLRNEVMHDTRSADGVLFRSWRFKPGQTVHLSLPAKRRENCFVVPPDAVVREGLDSFVFRKTTDFDPAEHADEPNPPVLELERIPVHVLERDEMQVALGTDGRLRAGDEIALGQAYQLDLALKAGSGGGGHHHHDH